MSRKSGKNSKTTNVCGNSQSRNLQMFAVILSHILKNLNFSILFQGWKMKPFPQSVFRVFRSIYIYNSGSRCCTLASSFRCRMQFLQVYNFARRLLWYSPPSCDIPPPSPGHGPFCKGGEVNPSSSAGLFWGFWYKTKSVQSWKGTKQNLIVTVGSGVSKLIWLCLLASHQSCSNTKAQMLCRCRQRTAM